MASFRSPLAVIDPSGKASCAATSNRNGVVGVMLSGSGMKSSRRRFLLGDAPVLIEGDLQDWLAPTRPKFCQEFKPI
jgi:hypothetical protein